MRTIVDLPDEQLDSLAELCRQGRISRAEAIRRAVALYISKHGAADKDEAFGLWRRRKVEGVAYQRRLRREWSK